MTTRIEMLNRALLRIGADPLVAETDPAAPVHLAVFDSVVDYLCGLHPWTFFRMTRRLTRLEAAPAQHFAYAFELPRERTGPIRAVYASAVDRTPTTDYRLEGDRLLTDLPEIWCKFMALQPPVYWPGEFREGFTLLLMSELALSVREDPPLRDKLRQQALGTPSEQPHGGVIGQAIAADSQGEPSEVLGFDDNPLISARW